MYHPSENSAYADNMARAHTDSFIRCLRSAISSEKDFWWDIAGIGGAAALRSG